MHAALDRNLFLVKEHVGMFKAACNYDVYDPATGELALTCREERLGPITKLLRFTDYKRMTPFDVVVRAPDGSQAIRISRGRAFVRSTVEVRDEDDRLVGSFRQKLLSIGGAFQVLDASERPLCMLKGKWTGWNFRFIADDGETFAQVTKRWSGVGKELFTSADNYVIEIEESVPPDNPLRTLIVGAVLCIDLVLKE